MTGMARAVQLLGLRACLVESIMDAGEGLPGSWTKRTSEECIQVECTIHMYCSVRMMTMHVLCNFEATMDFLSL